jgi:hypothetical protein
MGKKAQHCSVGSSVRRIFSFHFSRRAAGKTRRSLSINPTGKREKNSRHCMARAGAGQG